MCSISNDGLGHFTANYDDELAMTRSPSRALALADVDGNGKL
ncbi:MAG: hypothetical protein R2880_09700 [Deinococcales bacterium]